MNNQNINTEIDYPYVIFRLNNELFSVSGKYVSTIQQFPETIIHIPHAPSYVRGTFSYQGQTISIVDLRLLFGWKSVEEEYQAFSDMIEQRKNDHIHWVRTFEECTRENKEFPLATDFHQCALGKWRDKFKTKNNTIAHHLNKMDAPHAAIHHAAIEVMEYEHDHESGKDDEFKQKIVHQVVNQMMPQMLSILDETKKIFRDLEYREMILVLGGEKPVGLLVDEVIAVDDLVYEQGGKLSESTLKKGLMLAVQRYEKTKELVLELDVPGIKEKVDLDD